MDRITEQESHYQDLEKKSIGELLTDINTEDQKVAHAVKQAIPAITRLVEAAAPKLQQGGRLFYIGAGTSGRLGIVDASECPPTFGVPHDLVIAIMAGGDGAMRKAVEFAEDDEAQGWADLQPYLPGPADVLIGIAASGTTPYVAGALQMAKQQNLTTGCITCNPGSRITKACDFPVEITVGPEYVTGSTRMKAGTAQKLVLNMISTSLMISLGRVKGNKMVDMQLSNQKLIERGTRMLAEELKLDEAAARALLLKYGNVRDALRNYQKK